MSSRPDKSILQHILEAVASNAEWDARRAAIEQRLSKDWYTVPEAAKLLKEHPKTVYARVRTREIRASRPSPRKIRIHKRDLVEYLMRSAP
jgi:excisionase family DNA binding protein